jgi:hypothetical protein
LVKIFGKPSDRRHIRGRVAKEWHSALFAHRDPLVSLDLPQRLSVVQKEHHGRARADRPIQLGARFHPQQPGAGQQDLRLILALVSLLNHDLIFQAARIGQPLDRRRIAQGHAGDSRDRDRRRRARRDHRGR